MEKLKIPYPILVEGPYDVLRLRAVLQADIFTTDGFGIFNNEEKRQLLMGLAKKNKIIVLTDSDGGGIQIRSFVSAFLPKDAVIPLYIPQIKGKEKRKRNPSKQGLLGVEGMENDLLYSIFKPFAGEASPERERYITKTDFYFAGLNGTSNAQQNRDEFAKTLDLPAGMNANALLTATNLLISRDEFVLKINEKQRKTEKK